MAQASLDDAWDDNEFEVCYQQFDYDGDGIITRAELTNFIKIFAAL